MTNKHHESELKFHILAVGGGRGDLSSSSHQPRHVSANRRPGIHDEMITSKITMQPAIRPSGLRWRALGSNSHHRCYHETRRCNRIPCLFLDVMILTYYPITQLDRLMSSVSLITMTNVGVLGEEYFYFLFYVLLVAFCVFFIAG